MKKQKLKHLTARISPDLFNLLDTRSDVQGIPRSRLVEKAIGLFLAAEFPEKLQQKSA